MRQRVKMGMKAEPPWTTDGWNRYRSPYLFVIFIGQDRFAKWALREFCVHLFARKYEINCFYRLRMEKCGGHPIWTCSENSCCVDRCCCALVCRMTDRFSQHESKRNWPIGFVAENYRALSLKLRIFRLCLFWRTFYNLCWAASWATCKPMSIKLIDCNCGRTPNYIHFMRCHIVGWNSE